jgi:hypothetical protein
VRNGLKSLGGTPEWLIRIALSVIDRASSIGAREVEWRLQCIAPSAAPKRRP